MNIFIRTYYKMTGIKNDFDKLFFSKEYSSLTENFGINFFIIIFILLLTFFAFSFSIGSINFLDSRMNDPFTNWVDVPVTRNVKNQREKIVNYFKKDSISKKIYLDNISEYIIYYRTVFNNNLQNKYQIKGRTVESKSKLFHKIIDKDNLLTPDEDSIIKEKYENCGIIITQNLLNKLNFKKKNPSNLFFEDTSAILSVPIAAIVKDLPNKTEYISSNNFYNLTVNPYYSNFIVLPEETNIIKLISNDKLTILKSNFFETKGYYLENMKIDSIRFVNEGMFLITLIFSKPHRFTELRELIKDSIHGKNNYKVFLDNECQDFSDYLKYPHRLAFNFAKLDAIRNYKDIMKKKFHVEVNMAQIESKENFSLVSNLTFILSLILFIFSMISIIFFINSILTKHLQQIKSNIGTFKAFGINNKKLKNIYLKIILTYLLVSGIIAYIINAIISFVFNYFIEKPMFQFYSLYIIMIFISIIIVSLVISKYSILKVLKNTPGNLIYNRK